MNRLGIVTLAALTAAALTGCKTTAPVASPMAESEAITDLGYRVQWMQHLAMPPGKRFVHFNIMGDRIVTLDNDNIVAVVHGGDGRVLWRNAIGSEYERFSEPSRADKVLLLTTQSRAFTYDINTGEQFRQLRLTYASNTPSIIAGEKFINGSPTGLVFAQDLDDGILEWSYKMESAVSTSPMLVGPTLIVTTASGHVAAFNPSNGSLLWRERTFGRISAQPAANEAVVVVPSEDQSLYAYDRAGGRQLWRHFSSTPLRKSPWLVPDTELVLQRIGEDVLALNVSTGKVVWTLAKFPGHPVLIRKGTIYFEEPGKLTLVHAADARIVATIGLPGVHRVMTDNPNAGSLYLLRDGGQITKLVQR